MRVCSLTVVWACDGGGHSQAGYGEDSGKEAHGDAALRSFGRDKGRNAMRLAERSKVNLDLVQQEGGSL